MQLMEDVAHIRKMVKGPLAKVVLYTAPQWKWEVREAAIDAAAGAAAGGKGLDMGAVMKLPAVQERLKDQGKQVSKFAGALVKELNRRRSELEGLRDRRMDEEAILKEAAPFLRRELGAGVEVEALAFSRCRLPRGTRHIYGSDGSKKRGSVKVKTLPRPSSLSTPTSPPSLVTILRTIESPKPWPPARISSNRVTGVNNRD